MKRENERLLWEALGRLPSDDALLIRRKYLEGWSFDELAFETGKTSGALRVQAGRAMKKLKSALQQTYA